MAIVKATIKKTKEEVLVLESDYMTVGYVEGIVPILKSDCRNGIRMHLVKGRGEPVWLPIDQVKIHSINSLKVKGV